MALYSDPVTAEVVALFGQVVARYNLEYEAAAARHDLTALQAKALINVEEPMSMRELARRLRSEPPNVTGIVDRLQTRGLVERRDDPADRRVKMIAITESGKAITKDFKHSLNFAAEPLAALKQDERRLLRDLLRRMREAADAR